MVSFDNLAAESVDLTMVHPVGQTLVQIFTKVGRVRRRGPALAGADGYVAPFAKCRSF
jgi:hypothetical protein